MAIGHVDKNNALTNQELIFSPCLDYCAYLDYCAVFCHKSVRNLSGRHSPEASALTIFLSMYLLAVPHFCGNICISRLIQ